jgi:hypothetical protein
MLYNLVLRYDSSSLQSRWDEIQMAVVRDADPDADGPCSDLNLLADDFQTVQLIPGGVFAMDMRAPCARRCVCAIAATGMSGQGTQVRSAHHRRSVSNGQSSNDCLTEYRFGTSATD